MRNRPALEVVARPHPRDLLQAGQGLSFPEALTATPSYPTCGAKKKVAGHR